ncbi:MAG: S9 family peptidase [Sphingomonadales bacterium]
MFKSILIIVSVLLWGMTNELQSEEKRFFSTDDALAIKSIRSATISPNGNWIAYVVRTNDMKEDKGKSQIFMISRDGQTTLPLTNIANNASNPQWSPDGNFIAFTASKGEDAKTQVWTLNLIGGEAQAYTKVKQGVGGYEWKPDGTGMFLIIKDEKEKEKDEDGNDVKDKPEPWVIDRKQFKRDYVGYLDRRRNHIYSYSKGDEAPRQLTFGDYDDSQATWSPNGEEIAFVSNRTEDPDGNDNNDIFIVSVMSDNPKESLRQVTTNEGSDGQPSWSKDNASLTYTTITRPDKMWYATTHLATISTSGGEATVLTEALDRNISNPEFSEDGREVYFELQDFGKRQIAKLNLETMALTRITEGDVVARGFDRLEGDTFITSITIPQLPSEIFLHDSGTLTQVSHVNKELMADITLAKVENFQTNSPDGTEIDGWLFFPPDFEEGTAYPTILRIHGGPTGMYDYGFKSEQQVLAAQGYLVVSMNPRGSSGYGEDFSHALWAQWGVPDTEDVIAGVDYAIDKGYADPNNLGVGGWSYGGMLTNYVITKSTRFKTAISGASEANYTANYGHDVYQRHWETELGLPWENKELWDSISPFFDIGKVVTPTMFMGGKEDWNVPIMNSEQLYQALKRTGVDTSLVVYPGEFHGFKRPSFIKDRYERYIDWYDRFLKEKPNS